MLKAQSHEMDRGRTICATVRHGDKDVEGFLEV